MNATRPERYAPPWIFGITGLPYGVAGTYAAVAMPMFLRQLGLPVGQIAALCALALVPSTIQLFYAPILDLRFMRRTWLIMCATLGSLSLGASLLLKLPEHLFAYEVLMVLGQAVVGLVASCNGALVSTRVDPNLMGRAAGWVNAANLGSSVLGGGLFLTIFHAYGTVAAAIGLVAMIILPSLAALTIAEPPPMREPIGTHLVAMGREVVRAVMSRKGWTGLLFCISPVGTVAMGNLFSALYKDYGVEPQTIELVNGYLGGFVTAAGALFSGYFLDRINKRHAYLASGVLTAIVATAMGLAPLNSHTFVIGALAYLVVTGLAYAAFSAFVYEIVGTTAKKTASTLYSVFPAVGNQALLYTMLLDGVAHDKWGTRGMLYTDAGLNLIGVVVLFTLLWRVFPERKTESRPEALDQPTVLVEETQEDYALVG